MKKLILIIIFVFGTGSFIYSQNASDVLRYSQTNYIGTARALSMGGSFGSLGADFSSLSTNPAGIGVFTNNEFTISPSFYLGIDKSNYNGTATDDRNYRLNLGNMGLIFVAKPKKDNSIKSFQFGVGFNRLNNFSYNSYISGYNSVNSMTNQFKLNAMGTRPDDLNAFSDQLAYNTYLIDTVGTETNYFASVPRGGTLQTKSIEIGGSSNEIVLALGCNVNDKFYIGATFGFPYVRYIETSEYEETDEADTINDFKHMNFYNYLETHGTGFNFKLGLIYRPADWVRIGAAVHTPTFFSMSDKWNSEMTSEFDNGDKFNSKSPEGRYDYRINTPLKANASVSFIIGKYALITGEYEFVDYSSARLRSDLESFKDQNLEIRKVFGIQHNVRAGFEVKINDFALRGGYAFSSSPYTNNYNDGKHHSINGGVGVKFDRYFLDAAYSYTFKKENTLMYATSPYVVENKFIANTALITFGVKF